MIYIGDYFFIIHSFFVHYSFVMSEFSKKRILASVQIITDLTPISKSDHLHSGMVKGYRVVIDPKRFTNNKCVFFECDAMLDNTNPVFSFLKDKEGLCVVRPKTLMGCKTDGLCMELKELGIPEDTPVGTELTQLLNVQKYIEPQEKQLYANSPTKNNRFPEEIVPRTEEENAQNNKKALEMMLDRLCTVSIKADGTSMTVYRDINNQVRICSRNFILEEGGKDAAPYFRALVKYKKLSEFVQNTGISVQGELVGPKMNNNRGGFKELTFLVFNMHKDGTYFPHSIVQQYCQENDLDSVTVLSSGVTLKEYLINQSQQTGIDENSISNNISNVALNFLLHIAETTIGNENNSLVEGIVIKTDDHTNNQTSGQGPRLSLKVLSQPYKKKN